MPPRPSATVAASPACAVVELSAATIEPGDVLVANILRTLLTPERISLQYILERQLTAQALGFPAQWVEVQRGTKEELLLRKQRERLFAHDPETGFMGRLGPGQYRVTFWIVPPTGPLDAPQASADIGHYPLICRPIEPVTFKVMSEVPGYPFLP